MLKLGKVRRYMGKMGCPVGSSLELTPLGPKGILDSELSRVQRGRSLLIQLRYAQWAQDSGPDCTPH